MTSSLSRTTIAPPPQRLLGVWAHPDDESYLSAGLMARTIDQGGHVTLLTLTDGEEGFPADDFRTGTERALQRRAELRSAMARIGVSDIRFMALPDGRLAECDRRPIVDAIARVIDDVAPDVIVTFGPAGVTGHPDHVANCELVTSAWLDDTSADLWYGAKTTDWLDVWRDLHDEFGVWMTSEPTGVSGDEIEFVVDLSGEELDRKRAVLAGHHSQTAALAAAFGEDRYRRWAAQEAFRFPTAQERAAAAVLAGERCREMSS